MIRPSPDLVLRNPTTALVNSVCGRGTYVLGGAAACTQYSPAAILDLRIQNMERVPPKASISTRLTIEPGGRTLKLSLDGTYLFRFTQTEGPDSPAAAGCSTPRTIPST